MDDLREFDFVLKFAGLNMLQFYSRVIQQCDSLLMKCYWDGDAENCTKIFKQSTTFDGVCCSFNYDIDNHFSNFKNTSHFGLQSGLSLALNVDNSPGYMKNILGNGIKIIIHAPHTYPTHMAKTAIIEIGHETFFQVTKVQKIIAENIAVLPIQSRNCYFVSEVNLKNFKYYNFENCIAECLMSRAFGYCGCIPYYLPNSLNYNMCSAEQMACVLQNQGD